MPSLVRLVLSIRSEGSRSKSNSLPLPFFEKLADKPVVRRVASALPNLQYLQLVLGRARPVPRGEKYDGSCWKIMRNEDIVELTRVTQAEHNTSLGDLA